MHITKPKGQGPLHAVATAEGGSFKTSNQTGALSGSTGPLNYYFDLGRFRTGAFQVMPEQLQSPGKPRHKNV